MFRQQTADSRQQAAGSVTNALFEMCITPSI